jgi:hypothetical protein
MIFEWETNSLRELIREGNIIRIRERKDGIKRKKFSCSEKL